MIMLDLNVILDVVQKREPHYTASAAVLSRVVRGETPACVPAHAMTTLFYLVARYRDKHSADRLIDWLLTHCLIAPEGKDELIRARALPIQDFEDAVVASSAEAFGSASSKLKCNTAGFVTVLAWDRNISS
jgi:predicted nucleic acid-binding protein